MINLVDISYSDLRALISIKDLSWQYVEDNTGYNVFAFDNNIGYGIRLFKPGFEPINCSTCAADLIDFETNYKMIANDRLQDLVGSTKPNIGIRSWIFSHSFTDKTTWFGDSIRVTDEAVGTGTGVLTAFNLAHQYVIDLSHGKVSDEDYIVGTYGPVVKVASIIKTEIPFGETTGDYTIDYITGIITFIIPPSLGAAVTVSYSYSTLNSGSTLYIRPSPGKKLFITVAEAQFAKNLVMTDNLMSGIWTYNPVLGPPPAKFEYPGTRSRYKKFSDFVNYTLGAFPIIPSFSTGVRSLPYDILQLRYDYQTVLILDSMFGMELRVWTEHDRPYDGELATITFYGYQK